MANDISRRRALAVGGTALAAALFTPRLAFAQEVTRRVGHVLAPTHQFHLGLELAANQLAGATQDRVKMEVFPSSQLGTERDMNVAVRTGGVDMLLASPGGALMTIAFVTGSRKVPPARPSQKSSGE